MTFSRPTSRRQLIGTSLIAIGIIGGALCRNPYRQAHERGVKIIGATAHYVSEELDAGPGKWTGDQPISYSYQWQRCGVSSRDCSDLPEETASSYQTTAAADPSQLLKLADRRGVKQFTPLSESGLGRFKQLTL